MHDSQIEEQVRAGLRAEGDGLPLTITVEELERRLAARRRATNGRRLSLVAAAVAVVAVGSMVAATNGWLRLPAVGIVPAPSPSPAPSAPIASPTNGPGTGRVPLGGPDQAILVRPIGATRTAPDAFEVARLDPMTGRSVVIATIPGTVLPTNAWVSTGRSARSSTTATPVVSVTGWLAIPFEPGPNGDSTTYGIVVVDLTDPGAAPRVIHTFTSGSWNGADELAMIGIDGVHLASPASRQVVPFPIADPAVRPATLGGAANDPVWATAPGSRFVGTHATGATTQYGFEEWGVIGTDGAFSATTDLPPVYQRTGLERPAGADAHGLALACSGNGTITEAGCTLVETDATGKPIATLVTTPQIASLDGRAWAANGRDVWLLLDGGTSDGGRVVSLDMATATGRTERARIDFGASGTPAILGIASETQAGNDALVAIGDDTGFVRAFVAADGSVAVQDGKAWFAGWAGAQPDYDPD